MCCSDQDESICRKGDVLIRYPCSCRLSRLPVSTVPIRDKKVRSPKGVRVVHGKMFWGGRRMQATGCTWYNPFDAGNASRAEPSSKAVIREFLFGTNSSYLFRFRYIPEMSRPKTHVPWNKHTLTKTAAQEKTASKKKGVLKPPRFGNFAPLPWYR